MFTRKTSVQLPPAAAKTSHDTDRTAFSGSSRSPTHKPLRKGPGLQRADSQNTRYMNMLLALDGIPRLHNILAAFFTWILLAGFVLLPGTFTSLQSVTGVNNQNEEEAIEAIQHLPL